MTSLSPGVSEVIVVVLALGLRIIENDFPIFFSIDVGAVLNAILTSLYKA